MKNSILIILLSSITSICLGQTCFTQATSTPYIPSGSGYAESAGSYNFRLRIHVLRDANGNGGQPIEKIQQALCVLHEDFLPHNIHFHLEDINYIDDSHWFNFDFENNYDHTIHYDQLEAAYNNSNSIDILLLPDNIGDFGGDAHDVGATTFALLGGEIVNEFVAYTSVISHEVGHLFGLYHTFHGKFTSPGGSECREFVARPNNPNNDPFNCDSCGDYCCDTPADPNMGFNVSTNNCQWTGSGSGPNGDPYDPDEKNIMAYSRPSCMEYFTSEQKNRMHSIISQKAHLLACTTSTSDNFTVFDLYMRDTPEDFGESPSPGIPTDAGPDIWVRNSNDGLTNLFSEQLVYDPNANPSFYAYVRVINRGCSDYDNTVHAGTLDLHWSLSGTAQSWPDNWDGTNGKGDLIASLPIPYIPAGESHIFEIPWHVSSEYVQSGQFDSRICYLARIEGITADPTVQNTNLYGDVKRENNLTMKNLIIRNANFFKTDNWVPLYVGGVEFANRDYDISITDKDLVYPILRKQKYACV